MMNKAERYKLNEERLAIENIIHAFRALDNEQDGDLTLTQKQRDEYLDTIRGKNPKLQAFRYMQIQDL